MIEGRLLFFVNSVWTRQDNQSSKTNQNARNVLLTAIIFVIFVRISLQFYVGELNELNDHLNVVHL